MTRPNFENGKLKTTFETLTQDTAEILNKVINLLVSGKLQNRILFLLSYGFILYGCVFLDLKTRFSAFPIGILFLIITLAFSGIIPFTVVMMGLKKFRKIAIFIFLIAFPVWILLILEVTISNAFWSSKISKSLDRGDKIIQGIENFEANYQRYPTVLNEMVPLYLPEVPTTAFSDNAAEFFYENTGNGYRLSFNSGFKRRRVFLNNEWTIVKIHK